MNFTRSAQKSLVITAALALVLGVPSAAFAAPHNQKGTPPAGGTGRQGNGQPLRVMVMLNGKPFAGAHIAISVSDGSVVLRGITRANGVYVTTSLDQGLYTVTATTAHDTASGPVTLVQSTDPAVVSLTLAPKQ